MAATNTPPSTRELYPHREIGIVLFVIGVLLLVLAVVLAGYCQPINTPSIPPYSPTPFSQCDYPYAAGGSLLGVIGFVLLLVGIILMVSRNPAIPTSPPNVVYPWPAYATYPAWPPPPPPPQIACTKCGRVYQVGQHPYCPNCGTKLG